MTTDEKLDLIRRYYEGCSAGDIDAMMATFHEEVIHYFLAPNPGSAPVSGAEHLARYWRKVQARIDARWIVDSFLADGDDAVIEWSMFHTPGGAQERIVTRGAEWYRFEDGRIREIRSYHQLGERSSELDGFDYGPRGWSRLGRESSNLHPAE